MFRRVICILIPIIFIMVGQLSLAKERRPRLRKGPSKSEATAKPKAKKGGQEALVVVEGAVVYGSASFDGAPISYLPANKKVMISTKTYGPFYKIKVKKGTYGYISDVDVQIVGGGGNKKNPDAPKPDAQLLEPDKKEDGIERFNQPRRPMDEVKAMGLNVSLISYSEKINGTEPKSDLTAYGLKFSGPGLLLSVPMDINFAVALEAPEYYKTFSATGQRPSGYLIYTDALLQFPFLTSDVTMVYLGLGPYVSYLSTKVNTATSVQNITGTRIGAEAMLGMAFRMNSLIFRLEGKYFFDGGAFTGITLGILYAR